MKRSLQLFASLVVIAVSAVACRNIGDYIHGLTIGIEFPLSRLGEDSSPTNSPVSTNELSLH